MDSEITPIPPPYFEFEAGTLTGYVSYISLHTHSHVQTWIHIITHTKKPVLLSLSNTVEYWLSGTEVAC